MDAAKHTPGPWVIDQERGKSTLKISASDWYTFAKVYDTVEGERSEEGAANARLIAAAPDLLEALYRLKSEAEADGMDKRAGWDCWVSLANATIAKAEGRFDG